MRELITIYLFKILKMIYTPNNAKEIDRQMDRRDREEVIAPKFKE